jgi:hypothetical protein
MKTSFPEMELVDFIVVPTYKYDEVTDSWITDSFSMFTQMLRSETSNTTMSDVEFFLNSLFGIECCVDFISN